MTLGVGQILDPLNDLIESFSWLALLARVSLGTQLLLAEALVNDVYNLALTSAAALVLAAWWLPVAAALRTTVTRVFIVQTILVPVGTLLAAYWGLIFLLRRGT